MDTPIGLYEALITEYLTETPGALPPDLHAELRGLRCDEAADRIALHLAPWSIVRSRTCRTRTVSPPESGSPGASSKVIGTEVGDGLSTDERRAKPGRVLATILARNLDGFAVPIDLPLIPLLDTTLLALSLEMIAHDGPRPAALLAAR